MSHYFNSTGVKSEEKQIIVNFVNKRVNFITDNAVFSKNELDDGSRLLIESFLKTNITGNKCLDLGCGIGVVGIISNLFNANFVFDYVDINDRAVNLTQKNLKLNNLNGNVFISDCLDSVIMNKYDVVISNPPIRAGNKVLFKMFSQTYEVLNQGGKFICVLRIKQGAKTYIKHIEEIFGNSKILNKDKGFVICEFVK